MEALSGAEALPKDHPDPRLLVDDAWFGDCAPELLAKLERSLTRGAFLESHELAYSFCRFPDCTLALEQPQVMGACTMTDGVYCWPEGYWHYVLHHHVKPPPEFLARVLANHDEMIERTKLAAAKGNLLLWDEMEQRAVAMPRAMQEWVTSYTTIRLEC
ncbi:hypothetical protein BBJ28_00012344 [Nothophytophthora sp. Chile5]|nr:hypothetical protein BBJ28_00012344 [Nothophytophthora sp. Chile5]